MIDEPQDDDTQDDAAQSESAGEVAAIEDHLDTDLAQLASPTGVPGDLDETSGSSALQYDTDADPAEAAEELAGPIEGMADEDDDVSAQKDWYILKVQSNRENSIADALQRRIKVAGLDDYFEEIIVPVEKVTEFKAGKKRVSKRKLYSGYIVVHMIITDDTWFVVRETPGIGDFTGAAGHPTPMLPHEVQRIVATTLEPSDDKIQLKISFKVGDRVKINDGTFSSFEGDVDAIDETNGHVTIIINIFSRSTPVELEYWQIEAV